MSSILLSTAQGTLSGGFHGVKVDICERLASSKMMVKPPEQERSRVGGWQGASKHVSESHSEKRGLSARRCVRARQADREVTPDGVRCEEAADRLDPWPREQSSEASHRVEEDVRAPNANTRCSRRKKSTEIEHPKRRNWLNMFVKSEAATK